MHRRLVHVDINSYFATMLQQENPALRNRPVGVVKDEGRTCVIAASKEAKLRGVQTGENAYDAKKKAPDIMFVPAQFNICLAATRKLKKLFTHLSPQVSIFSLDEAFLDMTHCKRIAPDLHAFGRHIQAQIGTTLGSWVTCNVGIGPNKFLSKMASEISPKGSVFEINQDNLDHILINVPFRDTCGIGVRLEKKLRNLGVDNPYAINLLDDATLQTHFGPFWSKELKKMAQGKEPHLFTKPKKVAHMQSVGRTITGYKLAKDARAIKKTLYNLMEEATYKLRSMELSGRKISMFLKGGAGEYWHTHRTLQYWVRHTSEIFPILYRQYLQDNPTFPVIKFGVYVGELFPTNLLTQTWLPEVNRLDRIAKAMDAANDKLGRFTVMPARLLGGPIIHPEVTGFFGDKTYYGLE